MDVCFLAHQLTDAGMQEGAGGTWGPDRCRGELPPSCELVFVTHSDRDDHLWDHLRETHYRDEKEHHFIAVVFTSGARTPRGETDF